MGRVYGGQSAQDRTAARRLLLLDAATELIADRGLDDTTVRAVCERAGLSSRFFYESFDGLDSLAIAAFDRALEEAVAAIMGSILAAGPDRVERSRAAWRAIADDIEAHPARARLLFVATPRSNVLAPKGREMMHGLAANIMALGRESYAVDEDNPRVRITATLVAAGVNELLASWMEGSLVLSRDELIEHCSDLIVRVGDAAAGWR